MLKREAGIAQSLQRETVAGQTEVDIVLQCRGGREEGGREGREGRKEGGSEGREGAKGER